MTVNPKVFWHTSTVAAFALCAFACQQPAQQATDGVSATAKTAAPVAAKDKTGTFTNAFTGDEHGPAGEMPEHCAHHEAMAAADALPGQSLYHLQASLTDQRGAALAFDAFRGSPVLVTMFYASCKSICPMLISELQQIDSALPADVREQTKVLLISLDPERDTVERLTELAKLHAVTDARWHFTRTSESSVRDAAALLGIRYKRTADGEISHSPVISVLDRDGVVVARQQDSSTKPDDLVQALAKLTKK